MLRLIVVALALSIAPPSAAFGRSSPGAQSPYDGWLGALTEVTDPSVSGPSSVRAQPECLDGATAAVTKAATTAASTTTHTFMASTTTYSDTATFSWDAAGRARTAHVGGGPELQFGSSLNGTETMMLSVPGSSWDIEAKDKILDLFGVKGDRDGGTVRYEELRTPIAFSLAGGCLCAGGLDVEAQRRTHLCCLGTTMW